jgi:hypothetical protein
MDGKSSQVYDNILGSYGWLTFDLDPARFLGTGTMITTSTMDTTSTPLPLSRSIAPNGRGNTTIEFSSMFVILPTLLPKTKTSPCSVRKIGTSEIPGLVD